MIDRRGFSLIELLVALAVSAILIAVVPVTASADRLLRATARRISVELRTDRWAAVARGTSSSCRAGVTVEGGITARYPQRGLSFTPDGLPRACDGGGVGNTTILLEDRGRQAAVIVSSLGRVRWELR
jgi:prepilin-type N-terminal cleavage/methylation domain-containing protein